MESSVRGQLDESGRLFGVRIRANDSTQPTKSQFLRDRAGLVRGYSLRRSVKAFVVMRLQQVGARVGRVAGAEGEGKEPVGGGPSEDPNRNHHQHNTKHLHL
jgi:hypothetical protein